MTRKEEYDDEEKKKRRVKYWPLTVLVRKRTTSRMRDVLRTLSESFRDRLKRFDSTHNTDKYVCEQRIDVLLLVRFLFSFFSLFFFFSSLLFSHPKINSHWINQLDNRIGRKKKKKNRLMTTTTTTICAFCVLFPLNTIVEQGDN